MPGFCICSAPLDEFDQKTCDCDTIDADENVKEDKKRGGMTVEDHTHDRAQEEQDRLEKQQQEIAKEKERQRQNPGTQVTEQIHEHLQ